MSFFFYCFAVIIVVLHCPTLMNLCDLYFLQSSSLRSPRGSSPWAGSKLDVVAWLKVCMSPTSEIAD